MRAAPAGAGTPPVVLADGAAHVALLAGELVANRLRAGRRVGLHLGPGPVDDTVRRVLRIHAADGSLPAPAEGPAASSAGNDLAVVGAEDLVDLGGGDAPGPGLAALAAREVLVVAAGGERSAAVATAAAGPLSRHPCASIVCDRPAASGLAPRPGWHSDRVVVVLGHREPGISAEHRISDHSRARLRRAAEICRAGPPVRAAILTGWTHTGGLSEAEQMARSWDVEDVPAILEVAGRNTAENASRSLPLALALGAIRRVTVVTSAWHLRAPYFFAAYRDRGLAVDLHPSWDLRGWPHLVALEIEGLHSIRRARREAMAAVRIVPDAAVRPG